MYRALLLGTTASFPKQMQRKELYLIISSLFVETRINLLQFVEQRGHCLSNYFFYLSLV